MDFLNTTLRARLKSLFYKDFARWKTVFENLITLHDPKLWTFIANPYEKPRIAGSVSFKMVNQMSATERANFDVEKKTFETILACLPYDEASCYKTQETSFTLWNSLEVSYGSNTKLSVTSLDAGMKKEDAIKTSENEVDSEPSSCFSCIELTGKANRYSEDNERLNSDLEKLTQANKILKENEKACDKKLDAIFEEKKEYKAKIFSQQDEIDSYIKMMTIIKKELADSQAEVLDLKRKLSNFSTSSLAFGEILQSQRKDTKSKAGLGYHHVPPPKDYLPMPSKDPIKDFVPTTSRVDTNSVNAPVNEQVKKAEFVRPTFVKAESKPPVSVEEVIEVEEIPEESVIKVEKLKVKPENFIITTENDDRFKCKGKAKVDNESSKVQHVKKDSKSKSSDNSQSPVKNLKKDIAVDKSENNKCSTSTSSTSETSTSTCSPKSACSTNVPVNRPSVYYPPPKRFEGTHWNQSFVERRSCFRCGQQGHVIRDCRLLSLNRFGRGMPRTSSYRNSFSKTFSRRGSYSPVSSCASNSPKPTARVNKVVPNRPPVQQHNIVENKSSEPTQVWKPKSTDNTSMKSSEFLKYHKLIDVMVMDDSGLPKSIKAWVSHKY